MLPQHRTILSGALLLFAAVPPIASWWEAALIRHMLVQIPILVLSGALLAPATAQHMPSGAPPGQSESVAAILLAAFCLAFWMLPRWLDAAVADWRVDAAKIVTLVLLAGLPLGWGWSRLHTVAKAFVWVHAASMFVILGVLYLTFPDRLCNSYLVSEQSALGALMLSLGILLGLAGAVRVLFGAHSG